MHIGTVARTTATMLTVASMEMAIELRYVWVGFGLWCFVFGQAWLIAKGWVQLKYLC